MTIADHDNQPILSPPWFFPSVAFYLAVTLIFMLSALGAKGGWTLGSITTTNVLTPVPLPVCPPQVTLAGASCEASNITIYNTQINYGLFKNLNYQTDMDTTIQVRATAAASGQVETYMGTTTGYTIEEKQTNYDLW